MAVDRVHQDRYIAIGTTQMGRVLTIVFTEEDAPLVRIITAFEASAEQRQLYEDNHE